MPAHLLIVGLDAMEATLIDRGIASGSLPAFSRFAGSAAALTLDSPMHTYPGAIWPEINTGRSAETLGLYFHPCQLRTGDPVPRRLPATAIDATQDWWHTAGDAGRRVLVLDVPHSVPRPGTNGIHVTDWGNHDRPWDAASDPPEALDEVRALVGDHPIGRCDHQVRNGRIASYRRLVTDLLDGVERRTRMSEALLAREHWDLAMIAFTESHCVGHQYWAFTDPRHPVALPDRPPDLAGAIDTVYRAIDTGFGRLVDAAGPHASVMVLASHGMGPYVGGYQLLPEVLVRLGLRPRPVAVAAVPSRLPPRVRAGLRRVVPDRLRWRRLALAGTLAHHDLISPRTKATALLNNRCGAIRLNLRGREPYGSVDPGPEADALLAMLRRELEALTDPRSGERIVVATHSPTAARSGRGGCHPDLPDLVVDFHTGLGAIEACESPRVGRIDVPLWTRDRRPDGWPVALGRTGDHTPESRLWIRAPGIGRGFTPGQAASVRDVGPTALRLLGVDIPHGVEGRALVPRAEG
ncbi:MAG: hypothetical protein AMXMBFR46_04910 [Acidimicrobiia bacterium]